MALPPLAGVPPATIRLSIAPEEWEACLESWLTLAGLVWTRLAADTTEMTRPESSLPGFLRSFYHETVQASAQDHTLLSPAALRLRRTCFSLTSLALVKAKYDIGLLDFDFLAEFCRVHAKTKQLPHLMSDLFIRQDGALKRLLEEKKTALINNLNENSPSIDSQALRKLVDVMRASPEASSLFMTGSDFLDALASKHEHVGSIEEKGLLVAIAYFGLVSFVKIQPPTTSPLSDQLYSLKAQAERTKPDHSLLADLVTNTPFTAKLKRNIEPTGSSRLQSLLETIEVFKTPSIAHSSKHPRRKKGKGKAPQANGEMHVHRISLVTQVQDLFPDLGSGFVLKLLDEYDDDVEQVTAHLLDDSLPPHLRVLDRSEQAPIPDFSPHDELENLVPRSTPPQQPFIPDRRNIFDDDELDSLSLGTSKLHTGKLEKSSAEPTNKAAILSALAAFDSDDDERDDTYDVEDVGGTVDSAHPDGEPGPSAKVTQEENDMALFTAYKSSPEIFGRTFDVRRGQPRLALKAETGMSDEQIEGWAVILQRDPRRLRRLEERFGAGAWDGRQAGLARTAYRESPGGTETEDSDGVAAERGGFRGRSRGRGRGGRGRGGSVAGQSSEPSTAAAQRRKEANKGSRANHNRRDQRARKMARGGLAG